MQWISSVFGEHLSKWCWLAKQWVDESSISCNWLFIMSIIESSWNWLFTSFESHVLIKRLWKVAILGEKDTISREKEWVSSNYSRVSSLLAEKASVKLSTLLFAHRSTTNWSIFYSAYKSPMVNFHQLSNWMFLLSIFWQSITSFETHSIFCVCVEITCFHMLIFWLLQRRKKMLFGNE